MLQWFLRATGLLSLRLRASWPLIGMCLGGVGMTTTLPAEDAPAESAVTITIPAQVDLERFTMAVSEALSVPVVYKPEVMQGQVHQRLPAHMTRQRWWQAFNEILNAHDLATVYAVDRSAYAIVPAKDAPQLAGAITLADWRRLAYPPGFAQVLVRGTHLGAGALVSATQQIAGGASLNVKTLPGDQTFVVSGSGNAVQAALIVIAALDVPGAQPLVEIYRPRHLPATQLHGLLNSVAAVTSKAGAKSAGAEAVLMAESGTIALVGSTEAVHQLRTLAEQLDGGEAWEQRTYRPTGAELEDIATLVEQAVLNEDGQGGKIVRNRLTGSLIIKARAAQHARIAALLLDIEQRQSGDQRELVSLPVKHRLASDIVGLLQQLLAQGGMSVAASAPSAPALAEGMTTSPSQPGAPGGAPTANTADQTAAHGSAAGPTPTRAAGDGMGQVLLSADDRTNTLLVFASQRQTRDIRRMLERIDRKAPQVALEVILVALTEGESQQLGNDLVALTERSALSLRAGAFVGTITNGFTPAAPALPGSALTPGDFAVILRAVENVSTGRSSVRSTMVVDNGAKAALNSVLQQPIASINSTNTAATTTYAGTSDAGTQVQIQPLIGAGDQVSLQFTISQSSFQGVGNPEIGLPPAKRQDSFAAAASIPDGHTIVLGGIISTQSGTTRSGIPVLNGIPLVGWLFGSRQDQSSLSRFFIFIRADVLRDQDFADLIQQSRAPAAAAGISDVTPVLTPRFIE